MYEVKLSDKQWLLTKLLHAHATGADEAQVQRRENSFVSPQLLPSCLRVCSTSTGVGGAADRTALAPCTTSVYPTPSRRARRGCTRSSFQTSDGC